MTKEELKLNIEKLSYDYLCQDIEALDIVGHSKSHITWDLMKDMFDWNGKKVADLGCFHGYYSFKVEQAGALDVTGFDRSPNILAVTQDIRDLQKSCINLKQWELGQEVSDYYDIALLLCVLRYAPDKDLAIRNIKCQYLLCDVDDPEIQVVGKHFVILKRKTSWGISQRNGIGNLMLCERKHYNESN